MVAAKAVQSSICKCYLSNEEHFWNDTCFSFIEEGEKEFGSLTDQYVPRFNSLCSEPSRVPCPNHK